MTTRELLDAVLALPVEERAKFRDELDASLPNDEEDDAFLAMLDARVAAARAGAAASPGDALFARLRARLER